MKSIPTVKIRCPLCDKKWASRFGNHTKKSGEEYGGICFECLIVLEKGMKAWRKSVNKKAKQ